MKIKNCEKCSYFKRKVWTTSYKPAGYHRIGVSHAYGWCKLHKQRCLEVKKCKENNNKKSNVNNGFIEITKKVKIPCGEYCDRCEYIASKEIVKRNPWNDEIEDIETITYCNLYGDTLIGEKVNSCPYHCFFKYKKCLKCKANFMKKEEKDLTALLMLCLNNRNKGEQQ